jgi:hypothetical protein
MGPKKQIANCMHYTPPTYDEDDDDDDDDECIPPYKNL